MIHQAFKEHVFVYLSITIIILNCTIYFALTKIIYKALIIKNKHLNVFLLRLIIGRYRVASDIYILYAFYASSLLYCYKNLIDLHYKLFLTI